MEAKKEIRKYYIERRNRLSEEEVREKSALLSDRICSLEQYKKASVILAYMSFGNEVSTGTFITRCIKDGKTVALPKVEKAEGKGCRLSLYAIKDPVEDVVTGFKGIREPDPSRTKLMDPREIDLAVIPGVAFDAAGIRLGYGAGCYDRLLPMLRQDCVKIGAAFEIQLADVLPAEKHDFRLDAVVTERRTIVFPGRGINL
ncbi:MAG TPA: 5-formyltetrahydrofolate cyclo-ligase [Clostridiales bacterium]|nr:5-formyltetrahydrofolate cyclo-ligase [Clostridiales bacterium]HPV02210.1 5-formyltetrahydrofolate cyclo-ligase [Clostridiales bacterium]